MTKRGFTLLEILVSLAVLGMGLALVTQMTAVAARHSERVEEDTTVQLACENMMNSILAGNTTATIGVSTPIPDAPNWETTIELLDGPIDNLVAIRITAQRYQIDEVPSPDNPSVSVVTRVPDLGRRFVVKEWARRAEIKTRVVRTNSTGETSAVDGTGETVWNDLGSFDGQLGGDMGIPSPGGFDVADPFAEIDRASNAASGALGGGLNAPGINMGAANAGYGFGPSDGANLGGGLGGGFNAPGADSGFGYGGGF
ncbi:MAG: type II secretion system protein [Thermoguttaceae bacterium]|jgi:prepilin-type N-terminal cleavage/methylation domain-containing protein|nr:type II secretion system protein [Thermoguttaceae bacterium]